MTLNELNIGDVYYIKEIKDSSKIKRRLFDMGFIPNTKIECILKNNNISAYLIRNTLIAIRKIDAMEIEVASYV